MLPIVALLVVAGLAFAAFGGSDQQEPPPDDAAGQPTDTAPQDDGAARDELRAQVERRQEGDPLALGDVDAPVVMIEWADFQCPFCGRFARDTQPELVERFVDEGILRIEWRDLPLLGPESRTAAIAGRAAAEQGAFWALHDALYAEERVPNSGELERDALVAIAADLGLDVDRFEASLDDPDHEAAVAADLDEGRSLGITGTPAFLINGRPLIGGQPTEIFVDAIEQVAAEEGGA